MQVDVDVELNPSNLSLCTPMENTFCQLRCSSTKTKTSERSTKTKSFNFKYSYSKTKTQHITSHHITSRSKEASLNLLYPFFSYPFI